jgi:hypothetical protein
MTRRAAARVAALLASLAAAAGATHAPHPDAFAFAVVGDTPYSEREEREYIAMLARIGREPLAFVIHVGDFKGGGDCSDALFARRKAQFDALPLPVIYTPGDNEWADCGRAHMGRWDPLERLARLREVFFADGFSLGARRIATEAQAQCLEPPVSGCGCAAYPENRAWEHAGVRFATLNITGSDNNTGHGAASDAEARCRDAANLRWLERALRAAQAGAVRALVIAIQGNPLDSRKPAAYREFVEQLQAGAVRLRKPLLFIHGDTHTYRADTPFAAPITRLETYGSPFVGWVKVTVDPATPRLFAFEPRLQRFVPP